MIDYIKAAQRLRRILSSLKDQDPELDRIADLLERLGLQRKSENPIKQALREAGKVLRELEMPSILDTILSQPPEAATADLEAKLKNERLDHQESLIILKATQNERNELKRKLEDCTQERDAWKRSYDAVVADSRLPHNERNLAPAESTLRQLVLRYCAAVIDPGSMPAQERLALFQELLSAAKGG